MTVELWSRERWGALPRTIERFSNPQRLFVHHTTGTTLGADQSDDWMRNIDRQHHAQGWSGGIGYSWVFDQYGRVFEGRGWGVIGAHTMGWNSKAHGIALLGNGDNTLGPLAWEALRWLVAEHDNRFGQLPIYGHRSVMSTHCPGNFMAAHLGDIRSGHVPPPPVPPPDPVRPGPPWGWIKVDGEFGPASKKALQASLNSTGANPHLDVDGLFGPASKKALQGRLNHTNGPVAVDGSIGTKTIKALQAHVMTDVDGDWGPMTTTALQTSLNAATF